MREKEVRTLGEITDWFSGGTPSKQIDSYWNGDIPWISAKSLKGTRVSSSETKITKEGLKNGSRIAKKGDLLLLVRGSGLFNSIPISIVEENVSFNQDIKAIRIKSEYGYISPWFLLYWLHGNKRILNGIMEETGIGAGKFDLALLKDLIIEIPPIEELIEITKTIKSIDDKIILLQQQNQTLEDLAQTLFKRWFVDFEFPNDEGKPYKSSGSEMAASELGEIPEGWRVGSLGEIITILDSKRIPLSSTERAKRQGIYPYFGATSIMDYVDDYIFDGRYLLLGEDGSVIDENGYPILQFVEGKIWVNNHAHVLEGKIPFSTNYLFLQLRYSRVTQIVTGAVQLKINQSNLKSLEIIIPTNDIIDSFTQSTNGIFNKLFLNKEKIQSLTKLRDTLLPKLMNGEMMNGEIRVDIENKNSDLVHEA